MGDGIKQCVVRFGGGLGWVMELSSGSVWRGFRMGDGIKQFVVCGSVWTGLGWVMELSSV